MGVRGDTLFLNQETGIAACPLSLVEGLEVFAGRSTRWKKGVVIGAMAGGVTMAVLAARSFNCQNSGNCAHTIAFWFPIGAVPGGFLGLIIGSNIITEKWEAAPIHPPLLFVRPSPSGQIDLGLAVRFHEGPGLNLSATRQVSSPLPL